MFLSAYSHPFVIVHIPGVSIPWTESPRSTCPVTFGDEWRMYQRDEMRLMSLLLEVLEN